MSITDDVRPGSLSPDDSGDDRPRKQKDRKSDGPPRDGGGGGGGGGGGFDRTPPQDMAAEQCVLGGMLLSKDAIADVVEILKTPDFYRPIHATVFNAITDLYGRGEPADAITVAALLNDAGDLARIGGAPYLHTLIASVPTAANASYYARIVAERAVLRRLVEAGTRIVQLGYGAAAGGGRDVDDIVDLAQQAVYEITEKRVNEDFASLGEMLQPTLDEIEAIGAHGGMMTGVPTGFADLDRLLNGLHAGQLIIVAGRPGLGKALALDTPLPTPGGWTTMGDVHAGDVLLGADGRPTTVTHAFEVMHDRPCYEVEFSDGSVIVADAEHLWKTTTRAGRRRRAETVSRPQWPAEQRAVVGAVHASVQAQPNSLIALSEARELVGAEFGAVLSVVANRVGACGTTERELRRAGRPWRRSVPAYSRHDLFSALNTRVSRRMNQERTTQPRDVVTTAEIAATLRLPTDGRLNHAVENAAALDLPHRDDLPIPPYTLGVWLGDGHSAGARFTSDDPEMADYVAADGFVVVPSTTHRLYTIKVPPLPALAERSCVMCGARFVPRGPSVRTCGRVCGGASRGADAPETNPGCERCGAVTKASHGTARRCMDCHRTHGSFTARLRVAGVLGDKHVPADYLRGSEAQRRALLAGLLDTDGTVTPTGNVQFTSTSRRLTEGVFELVVSLGYRCSITTRAVEGRRPETAVAYTLNFTTVDEVFRLRRKREAHRDRRRSLTTSRSGARYVVDVRPVASVPVRCVTVDNADHMYLAGRAMIPTHNSTASMDFARNAAIRANQAAAIFSLEMSKVEIVMRVLSAEARVPLHVLRSGQLSDDDWTKLARSMGEISEAPLFVDDTPNMNLMEIRAKARRLKQRHDLKLIVVDYLQLMSSPARTESRQQEVAELSRGLKLLAKEVEAPVIAVSQLNRGPEQRTDKRPQLSDLRESGSIEQDADVVILLHRDDYYDKESPRAGEADFIVAKHRNGPTDTITVAAQLHLSRFVDMAM
ncbi:replicative DNA helicase [Catenuloplanes sp. NPDC051500]|uniref:replicative DNA helicase n=1 Tax=Catenuloplanes sp. NPDC051500 TaxID=3363959 RepID=UPI0037BC9525